MKLDEAPYRTVRYGTLSWPHRRLRLPVRYSYEYLYEYCEAVARHVAGSRGASKGESSRSTIVIIACRDEGVSVRGFPSTPEPLYSGHGPAIMGSRGK